MKIIKKAAAWLLLAAILLLSACAPIGDLPGESTDGGSLSDTSGEGSGGSGLTDVAPTLRELPLDREKYVYKRPDFAAVGKKAEALLSELASLDRDGIVSRYESIEDELYDATTMYTLLDIMLTEEASNEDMSRESVELAAEYAELSEILVDLDLAAIASPARDELFPDLTNKDIDRLNRMKKLFDEEYVTLSSRETELENDYMKASTTTTVVIDGRAMTLDDITGSGMYYTYENLIRYLDTFSAAAAKIVVELVSVRNRIAEKAGYASYAEYAYDMIYERDYTPSDAAQLADSAAEDMVTLYAMLYNNYTEEELSFLEVGQYSEKYTLTKFESVYKSYFSGISSEMLVSYEQMLSDKSYSIGGGPERQQTSYTTYLSSYGTPFLMLYTGGGYNDISTFIHEFGHYYAYDIHGDELSFNVDICELHSQMNELLFTRSLPDILGETNAYAVEKNQIESLVYNVISAFEQDEFQRLLYSGNENFDSVEEINSLYAKLNAKYGMEGVPGSYWALYPHTFSSPFYYISYGTSALVCLELYFELCENEESAREIYRQTLALGTECGFTELQKRIGLDNIFTLSYPTFCRRVADSVGLSYGIRSKKAA